MTLHEPEYYVKLNMQGCPRVIAINGVEIEADLDGTSNFSEYPINHWIRNGQNQIELLIGSDEYMKDAIGALSRCALEVRVKGRSNGEEVDHLVTDLVMSTDFSQSAEQRFDQSLAAGQYKIGNDGELEAASSNADVAISQIEILPDYFGEGGFTAKRDFEAKVPFPEWAFFDGEKIFSYPMTDESYDQMEAELWPKVLELRELFDKRALDKLLPMFEMRSREYDQAYYFEEGKTLQGLKESFQRNYELGLPQSKRDLEYMQLYVSYMGNMATIANAATGNGTIMFYDKRDDTNTFYTIYWIKKDGEWIIAR